MASKMTHAYVKLSSVPLPLTMNANGISTAAYEAEVENWRILHEWLRSVDWIPVVPLPYNPNGWKSVASLRILNISNIAGVKKCVWQLGSDFDVIGAASYVGDLITLQTMVDAFENKVENWGVIGADISTGSDPEETRLYSDLTKHTVEAIGWMQPPENNIPESQNAIVPDNDYALKIILERNTPIWLSTATHSNMTKRSENWSGISIADGVQWTRMLGDAARIGFDVIYKPLNEKDFTEENLSYFSSLLFKQIMGNKVFDARVIGGNRFISHVYCHCTKGRPGAISIMAVNIGENRHKLVAKMSNKHTGTELWQYILTSNNKTTYLNGEEIHFNSTMEPFIKVKHPSRPINLSLPPMSIGFWILPLANYNECLKDDYQMNNDRKSYTRVRSSSDALLRHLIEKSTTARKATNTLKPKEEEEVDCLNQSNDCSANEINRDDSRNKRSIEEHLKKDTNDKTTGNSIHVNGKLDKTREKRELDNLFKTPVSSIATVEEIPSASASAYYPSRPLLPIASSLPNKNEYYEIIDRLPKDPKDEHILKQLTPIFEPDEINQDKTLIPQAPGVFYEIYHIQQSKPKNTNEMLKRNPQHLINNQLSLPMQRLLKNCDQIEHMELTEILKGKKSTPNMYAHNWQHRRRRRSPVYKALSVTNFITKDMEGGGVIPRRYIKLPSNKNIKPINLEDIAWKNPISSDSGSYETNDLVEKNEEQSDNSKESQNVTPDSSNTENHGPKFMIFLNENISKFMKMLNNNVNGWWNSWA